MHKIIAIPAFTDNYLWLIQQGSEAIVVDPGDAQPVLNTLQQQQLTLRAILITHHHADHIGGVQALIDATGAKVYAPCYEAYAFNHIPVQHGQQIHIADWGLSLEILHIPGHTLGHIAYYGAGKLFCGDTLFSAGCGRLFEGSPSQMLQSLTLLSALPSDTAVYCTHEYTSKNIQFALTVEPDNPQLQAYQQHVMQLRQKGLPSLPTTLKQELAINPFLRCHQASIQANCGLAQADTLSVFTRLRELRNHF